MIEKRHFLRIPVSVPLSFRRIAYVLDEKNIIGDLSVQGVRFFSQKFVPVFTNIKIEIKLQENIEPIRFIAKTAWARYHGEDLYEIGAKIVEISKECASTLLKLF